MERRDCDETVDIDTFFHELHLIVSSENSVLLRTKTHTSVSNLIIFVAVAFAGCQNEDKNQEAPV